MASKGTVSAVRMQTYKPPWAIAPPVIVIIFVIHDLLPMINDITVLFGQSNIFCFSNDLKLDIRIFCFK